MFRIHTHNPLPPCLAWVIILVPRLSRTCVNVKAAVGNGCDFYSTVNFLSKCTAEEALWTRGASYTQTIFAPGSWGVKEFRKIAFIVKIFFSSLYMKMLFILYSLLLLAQGTIVKVLNGLVLCGGLFFLNGWGFFSRSKLLIFTSGEILNKGILNPNSSCVPEEHSPHVHSPYIGLWTWEVQTKLIFWIEDRCKTFLIVIRSSCYCWISQAAWLALHGSSYHSSSLRDFSVAFLLLWEFPGCAKNRTYCIPFFKKKEQSLLAFPEGFKQLVLLLSVQNNSLRFPPVLFQKSSGFLV